MILQGARGPQLPPSQAALTVKSLFMLASA